MNGTGPDAFAALSPGTPVTVRALKYDGAEYRRWTVDLAECRADGVVLEAIFSAVVEGRTPFFGGDRAVEYFYADRGYNVIAGYAPGDRLRACYCNICLPAHFVVTPEGPEIHFVDLDLDVLVLPSGDCTVTDEDEFATNAERYEYTEQDQAAAWTATEGLLAAVRQRRDPFDRIGLTALPVDEQVTHPCQTDTVPESA